jgi:hypothetical protein
MLKIWHFMNIERSRSNVATIVDLLPEAVMVQLRAAGKTQDYSSGELIQ